MDAASGNFRLAGLEGPVWSVADQAVVSLGTFLTSIALARNLSPSDYGVYSALVAALLFFNGIHISLVTSPLSVKGAAVDRATLRQYATASLLFTIVLAAFCGLILLGFLGRQPGGSLWIWAPLSLLLWQLQETMRRSLMCGLGHRRAVWGDAVSYLGQAAVIWAGCRSGSMTLGRAFAVMGLTSGAAAVIQALQTGLARVELQKLRALARDYWKFGSWILYGCFASMFCSQAFFWVLTWSHGAAATASLQAVSNVLGVSHPVMFGLGNLLVPVVSRAKAAGGVALAWRSALKQGSQFGWILLPYFVVLLIWPRAVLGFLYGAASSYAGLAGPLRLLVGAYAFAYAAQVLGLFLTGVGDAKATFGVQAHGALASVVAGLPLAGRFGVVGACVGMVAVNATRFIAGFAAARRCWRAEAEAREAVEIGCSA